MYIYVNKQHTKVLGLAVKELLIKTSFLAKNK